MSASVRARLRWTLPATIAGTAVLLAGCGEVAESTWGATQVSVALPGPVGLLSPTQVADPNEPNLVADLFTGLTRFRGAKGTPVNAAAAKLETTDQTTWLVTLRKGWTFHDGSPMTPNSFVDAWNYAAYEPHGAANRSWFESIVGFDQVSGQSPASQSLAGLQVVDDLQFTITLTQPNSQFPVMLASPAFAPLPQSFYADPAAFVGNPIGNGPFRLAGAGDETEVVLERFAEYAGPRAKVDRVTLLPEAAPGTEADVALHRGEVPAEDAATTQITQPSGTLVSVVFPVYDPRFADPEIRAAISSAIDRDLLIESLPPQSREKAGGWVSPVANGYRANGCGVDCSYNAGAARTALAQAGGFDGDLAIAYEADQETAVWVEALCRNLTNVLDIACSGAPFPNAEAYSAAISARTMTGPFVVANSMDYPSIVDYLGPRFATGSDSNLGGYSNPFFEAALAKGESAPVKEATKDLQAAEKVLGGDLPSAPLWFTTTTLTTGDNVAAANVTPYSHMDLPAIEVR